MSRKDSKGLIRELERQGFTVVMSGMGGMGGMGGKGHWKVIHPGGRLLTTLPVSPSDHRVVCNAIAVLKRAGLLWPPR